MSINRESIIRGPGAVKLGSTQIYDKDGIECTLETETFDIPVSAIGNVDTRLQDAIGRTDFTPSGRVTADLLAALYPYGTPNIGADIFGDADVACEVHSLAGKKLTWTAAAITQMPQLRLSAKQTLFGACQISHVIGNGMDRATANSLYTIADEAFSGAYDKADVKCKPVSAAWGASAPWAAIKTQDGWTVDFDLQLEPVMVDENGTIGMQIGGVIARARCQPLGLTEANVFDALNTQGTGHTIGDSIRTGNDLVLTGATGGGVTVTLKDCALVEGPLAWGQERLRSGEIGFITHRAITSGVGGPVFSIALTA